MVVLRDEDTIPTVAAAATASGEGTIVKCSVSLSPNYKSKQLSAQMGWSSSPFFPPHAFASSFMLCFV